MLTNDFDRTQLRFSPYIDGERSMGASVPEISSKRLPRRSKRLGLRVPVLIYGQDTCGQPFHELTHTLEINANGALILLDAFVQERQTILLENLNTQLDEECRVANVRALANGRWVVGIEFKQTAARLLGNIPSSP